MKGVPLPLKVASKALGPVELAMSLAGFYHVFDEKQRNNLNNFGISPFGEFLGFNKLVMYIISITGMPSQYTEEERIVVMRNRFPNEAATKELFHYG